MWRRAGDRGPCSCPSRKRPRLPLGEAQCCLECQQVALTGQVCGASGTPTGFRISFLAGGCSSVWGKIKEVREGQGLDLEAADITKKPKPRGGNPLLLWGVTVTLEMAGELPVKCLKWTKQENTRTPAQQAAGVFPCTVLCPPGSPGLGGGPPFPRVPRQAHMFPNLQPAPTPLKSTWASCSNPNPLPPACVVAATPSPSRRRACIPFTSWVCSA